MPVWRLRFTAGVTVRHDRRIAPPIIVRTAGWNFLAAGSMLLLSLVSASIAANGGLAPGFIFGVVAGLLLVVAVRAVRAGVVVSDSGITVRGFTRTHDFAWADVSAVTAGDSGNVTGAGRCVMVRLTNGRQIRARGCASYSRARIERIVETVERSRPEKRAVL
jgi:Bacterial PH domain